MELWARKCPVILPKFRLPRKIWDLLHAANLRRGTDGFTSPPKEDKLGTKILSVYYVVIFFKPYIFKTYVRVLVQKDFVIYPL